MLSAYDTLPAGAPESVTWSVRARLKGKDTVVHARDHTLSFSRPVSFLPKGDSAPSALEGLLAALAGELVSGFMAVANRQQLTVDACEVQVVASLENPLVAAGVIGEEGSPALGKLAATLYVATPDAEGDIRAALDTALTRGPVYATLARACPTSITLKITL
ncbi:MAG: OsmC family protein [Armatimonas sp.]